MKKLLIILTVICACSVFEAAAQMTDDALIEYVKTGVASGKSQNQMAAELSSQGVSVAQMKRVMAKYQSMEDLRSSVQEETKIDENRQGNRQETLPSDSNLDKKNKKNKKKDTAVDQLREGAKTEDDLFSQEKREKKIYGHDIFNAPELSFEPNSNAATPDSYVLGPGDEVIIDIWGENEATIRQTISPEGRIMVSQIGPVQLAGLTIDAARARIRKSFASKYSALGWSASQVSVSLGKTRTIVVNVMGEVKVPGTYRLSSFATVFTALYNAGGVTDVGSVREVKVSRGSEIVASVDIYQYIFNGYAASDIPLKDGDVVIVPASRTLVEVKGEVKRPMFYELAEGETLANALEYAGGFGSHAYRGDISIVRQTGGEQVVRTVSEDKYATFTLVDGDSFEVQPALERFSDRLEIKGAVKRPGIYQLGDDIKTVSQLIGRAGGLREDAFLSRAQIVREMEDLSLEVVAISLAGIMDGSASDVLLKSNDVVYISSSNDIEEKGDITINGYVANPGTYPFADHGTVEDLILIAGGLADGASTVRVDVSRRIIDPESTSESDKLAEVFTFHIKDGLMVDGNPDFIIKPYDVVTVRKSPTFVEQRTVNLIGEVVFPGQYTLQTAGERISDLINRAGGATKYANLHGALLKRKITDEEREIRKTLSEVYKKTVEEEQDSTITNLVADIYNVGVQVDKAVKQPGSEFDLIMRDGDELVIPEINNTVSIQGEVLYPNIVSYNEGKPVQYYINQAGGVSEGSRKGKTFVVYPNGAVSAGLLSKVEPGCAIVVPKKAERQPMSASEVMSIGSSSASLAAVILSIVNMMSK